MKQSTEHYHLERNHQGLDNRLVGEFLTAVYYEFDVKVVILHNSKVGLIKLDQESEGYPETMTSQHNPDYAAFAAACGGAGFAVTEPSALESTLRAFLQQNGPAILAVRVDPNALIVPPKVTLSQAWPFGLARAKELFT